MTGSRRRHRVAAAAAPAHRAAAEPPPTAVRLPQGAGSGCRHQGGDAGPAGRRECFSSRRPLWHSPGWHWPCDRAARKVVRIRRDRPSWAAARTARQFNRITAGQGRDAPPPSGADPAGPASMRRAKPSRRSIRRQRRCKTAAITLGGSSKDSTMRCLLIPHATVFHAIPLAAPAGYHSRGQTAAAPQRKEITSMSAVDGSDSSTFLTCQAIVAATPSLPPQAPPGIPSRWPQVINSGSVAAMGACRCRRRNDNTAKCCGAVRAGVRTDRHRAAGNVRGVRLRRMMD